MYEISQPEDLAILVALAPHEEELDELAELVETSGSKVVGRMVQPRDKAHPGHYIGKGKLEELENLIGLTNATAIVCDDELSSAQQRGLANALDVKILDRTMVILDIFASRANTSEGKLQVELAQLSYNISHLSGLGKQLSRLGGGIGTRGPGEKKLETDRRHIRTRLTELEGALGDVRRHRATARAQRKRSGVAVVSLVGYTNAGKSTLLNSLCLTDTLAQDKLFATLDTTTRSLELPGGMNALLTDTVGFIRKLPHGLIRAFRATLEELQHSDLLLHVVDSANPYAQEQIGVVNKTLEELGCFTYVITVLNKVDVAPDGQNIEISGESVPISAKTGQGLDELRLAIAQALGRDRRSMSVLIPYEDGQGLALVYALAGSSAAQLLSREEQGMGSLFELVVTEAAYMRLQKYSVTML